ncbi:MAG: hypothetical protein H6706_14435 [Myxococcales bacterium]|nr:hypothetical protein [Myxococcales bacterium]
MRLSRLLFLLPGAALAQVPVDRAALLDGIEAGRPISAAEMRARLERLADAIDALSAPAVCPTLRAADGSVRRYVPLRSPAGQQICRVETDRDIGDEMVRVGDFWIDRFETVVVRRTPAAGAPDVWHGGRCDVRADLGPTALTAVDDAEIDHLGEWSPDAEGYLGLVACSADFPVPPTTLRFAQAAQVCAAAGKRLCRAAEWSAAAVGVPFTPNADGRGRGVATCHTAGDGLRPVGAIVPDPGVPPQRQVNACVSRFGAVDLFGNVGEWVSDATSEEFRAYEHGHRLFMHSMGGNARDGRLQASAGERYYFENEGWYLGGRCCAGGGR